MTNRIMIFLAVAILTAAVAPRSWSQGMPGEVVPQSQAVLDAFFTTSAIPGQLQYWELIDTLFFYINATYTNSQAAELAAQNSQAINNRVIGSAYFAVGMSSGGVPSWTYYATNGISSNAISQGTFNPHGTLCYYVWLTNYFAAPPASISATPFNGPLFFTLTMPSMSGGVLTNSPFATYPGNGLGSGVAVYPYTTSDSTNTFVLTTNFFAFYVNLGGNSAPNRTTNSYLFTFYQ